MNKLSEQFAPVQLGVDIFGSCSTCSPSLCDANATLSSTFQNAFNSLRADNLLKAIVIKIPEMGNLFTLYSSGSISPFDIKSEEGPNKVIP